MSRIISVLHTNLLRKVRNLYTGFLKPGDINPRYVSKVMVKKKKSNNTESRVKGNKWCWVMTCSFGNGSQGRCLLWGDFDIDSEW
jgi:hypothetical protein